MWWNLSVSTKRNSQKQQEMKITTVLCFLRQWSVGVATRGAQGRHKKTRCIICIDFGPTKSLHVSRDHTWRTPSVPLSQVGRQQRRSKDPQQVLYWGGQGGVHKQRHGGFHWSTWLSLGHSQGRARRRTYGRGQPSHTGVPGHLGGMLKACLWSRKIRSFKMYNIPNKPRKGIW